jgi:hypothetical protein
MSRFQMQLPTGRGFAFGFDTVPLMYGYFIQIFKAIPPDPDPDEDFDCPEFDADSLGKTKWLQLFEEKLTPAEQVAVRALFKAEIGNICCDLDPNGQSHGQLRVTALPADFFGSRTEDINRT